MVVRRGRPPSYTDEEYFEAYERNGFNATRAAAELGCDHTTVLRAMKRLKALDEVDTSVSDGMAALGMRDVPLGGWVKSTTPDANGRTYSFRVNTQKDTSASDRMDLIERAKTVPPVILPKPALTQHAGKHLKGFIPLNDLHAGAYAWAPETGYADWDINMAVERLTGWVGNLVHRMPVVEECILFFNGDTLHANGQDGMTPHSKHILDTDGRHFKVADMTATAIITTIDLAAQKHNRVRVVIKRGNHDEDSYLALLLACKWRYIDQDNVTVEEDPSPFWAHQFGKVMLFGHHGDRVKPADLVMKMAADHPVMWGDTRHRVVWTAHKHQKEMKTFRGATWEQASCLTDPDAYGAYYGNNAQAQAVIYHAFEGETERFTVRPSPHVPS